MAQSSSINIVKTTKNLLHALESSPTHDISAMKFKGTALAVEMAGDDPCWVLDNIHFQRKLIQVAMSVEPGTINDGEGYYCQIFFQEEGMGGFDEEHSIVLPIKGFKAEHTYLFRCAAFKKNIKCIRFDPLNHPGHATITRFELIDCEMPGTDDISNLFTWTPVSSASDDFWVERTSEHHFKVNIINMTASFDSPFLDIQISPYVNQDIYVRMKITKVESMPSDIWPCAKLYFQTDGMTKFDEDHSLHVFVEKYGEFCEFHFRIYSYIPTTIRKLRFVPINHPGSAEIGCIRLERYEKRRLQQLNDFPKIALVFGSGRSGTTLLMKLLSFHENITCFKEHPHEAYILSYFMKFYALIKNTPHVDELDTLTALETPINEGGRFLPQPVAFQRGLDLSIFRGEFKKFLAAYLPSIFNILEMDNLNSAHYYLEKYSTKHLIKELFEVFPDVKVIHLFRDPRNLYLSIKSFEKKMMYKDWSKRHPNDHSLIRATMEDIRDQIRIMEDRAQLGLAYSTRYEDIAINADEVIANICKFLDIPCTKSYLEKVKSYMREDSAVLRQHRTSNGLKDSVERYQRELKREDMIVFEEYKDVFDRLGYKL